MKKADDVGIHKYTTADQYTYPIEPELIEKLEWFKDLKLGFMSHFGLYNHYGIVESWSLSDELDNKKFRWSQRQVDWTENFAKYREEYFESYKAFNPTCFSPTSWVRDIKRLGFKYAIVTSKHHDGFCMWDTKTTDYKVTSSRCAYSTNANANIIPELYKELRENDIGIATYFSKPDWSSNDYWCKQFEESYATTRNKNYKSNQYPEKWNNFLDYSHKQIEELVLEHGPVDILWLDGGWVNANNDEDFRLNKIVPKLRKQIPNLLVCDRTNKGIFENYVTPEQEIPQDVLDVPWESCITIGSKFGYEYDANYKSGEELIELFVDVLTKGGNLVINVAPQPNGKLPDKAISELNHFSKWVEKNKLAIFATRPVLENETNNLLTMCKEEKEYYLFYPRAKGVCIYPKYIYIDALNYETIKLVDDENNLEVEEFGNLLKIKLPEKIIGTNTEKYLVFKIQRSVNE